MESTAPPVGTTQPAPTAALPITTVAPLAREPVAARRLWWVGPLTLIASIAANALVTTVALVVFQVSPEFEPLTYFSVINMTTVGVLGAVVVFAVVARLARQPIQLFRRMAFVVLLLSFLAPLALLASGAPGATVVSAGTLMTMHVVAAVISVGLLTTLTREN